MKSLFIWWLLIIYIKKPFMFLFCLRSLTQTLRGLLEDIFSWRPSAVVRLYGILFCHLDKTTGTWTATGVGLTALFGIGSHSRWLLVLGKARGRRLRDLGRRCRLVFAGSLLAGLETRTGSRRGEFLLILRIEEGFSFPSQRRDRFFLGRPLCLFLSSEKVPAAKIRMKANWKAQSVPKRNQNEKIVAILSHLSIASLGFLRSRECIIPLHYPTIVTNPRSRNVSSRRWHFCGTQDAHLLFDFTIATIPSSYKGGW